MPKNLNEYIDRFNDLRTVFDNLPDGIIGILDNEMNIATANKAFSDMLGIPLKKIISHPANELFKDNFPELLDVLKETARTQNNIRNYTINYNKNSDSQYSFLVSTSIIKELQDQDIGIVLILHDISEISRLRKIVIQMERYGDIVGKSEKMNKIFSFIESIKDFDTSLLIMGETGTGKELVARAVHNASKRKNKPFIPVNCSAIPENLIESELFGHAKGAFTGAISNYLGRFSEADEGTLFLDEVGSLPSAVQIKLLRVLQDKIIQPLGSSRKQKVSVRIIAASNRDLVELSARDFFREDLYYRLKVLQINLPPLRERIEDLPLLVDYFINKLNKLYNKNIIGISPEMKEFLTIYNWPGNIRELENAIEHAYVSTSSLLLQPNHLPPEIRFFKKEKLIIATPKINLNEEEEEIRRALLSSKGRVNKAALKLGIHRTTLWRKIREYGISKNYGK